MNANPPPVGIPVDRRIRPLREGEVLGAYLEFDRTADPAWTNSEYLLRFGVAMSAATVRAITDTEERCRALAAGDGADAFKAILKYAPCSHDSADTTIGDGKTWAKCHDCHGTFFQDGWAGARKSAKQFDDAIEHLRALLAGRNES